VEKKDLTLRRALGGGLLYAAGFSVIAAVMIAIGGVGDLVGASKISDWSQFPLGFPVVILSYVVAGALGGIAFWALKSARRGLIGWLLTGFIIAALVYGSVGLTGVLGFYFGIDLLDLESAAEGWSFILPLMLITGVAVGLPGGAYFWYRSRKR